MKKKILTAVIAIVAVCALFATGTIAYLTATTDESGKGIVNTFVSSDGLIDPVDPQNDDTKDNGFFIKETLLDSDGSQTSSQTTSGNKYVVMPNVPIKKDARFIINGKTDVPAYAFVVVSGKAALAANGLTFDVDSNWVKLDIEGKNGDVYVYNTVVSKTNTGAKFSAPIIASDEITVADDFKLADGKTDAGSLSFLGFLCQEASFEAKAPQGTETEAGNFKAAATEAFKTCFADQVKAEESKTE